MNHKSKNNLSRRQFLGDSALGLTGSSPDAQLPALKYRRVTDGFLVSLGLRFI